MDPGLLVDGRTSAESPALFTTLWRLWQIPFCVAVLMQMHRPWRCLRPLIPLFPYFGWVLVCTAINDWDMITIKGLADLLLPYLVTAILAGWIFEHPEMDFFKKTLWISFWFIVILTILLGLLGLQPFPGTNDPTPGAPACLFLGVGSPNPFLDLCACLLFLTLAEADKHPVSWVVQRTAIILIPCTMALFRATLGGLLGAVLVAVLLRFRKVQGRRLDTRKNRRIALGLVMLLIAGILSATPILMRKMMTPDGEVSFSGRLDVWPIYLAAAIQHPIWGLGPNGDVRLGTQNVLLYAAGQAHSDYLMQAICYGAPGLLLWMGGMWMLFRRALRLRNGSEKAMHIRLAAIFSFVALGITMIMENKIRGTNGTYLYMLFPVLANLYYLHRNDDCSFKKSSVKLVS
jgi:O-antigen ligase